MRKLLIMLAILFLCGLITSDICIGALAEQEICLNMESFLGYANAGLSFRDTFWKLLYARGKLLIAIFILCITPLRRQMPVIILTILTFCLGFFTMSCVRGIGFAGIFVAMASVMPHGIFYLAIFLLLYREKPVGGYRRGAGIVSGAVTYLFMLLFFLTGCVLECLMGIHLIPWVIRLSQI